MITIVFVKGTFNYRACYRNHKELFDDYERDRERKNQSDSCLRCHTVYYKITHAYIKLSHKKRRNMMVKNI